MTNLSVKCSKCKNFFGSPDINDASFILIHNSNKFTMSRANLCDKCFETLEITFRALSGIDEPALEELKD